MGINALDARTLRVDLEQPASYFLQTLASGPTMPVPKHIVDLHGEAWTEGENFVSNGRFLLESRRHGESMIVRRNPTYHGSFDSNVQRIVFHFDRDFETIMPLHASDQMDYLNTWDFTPEELVRATQQYADDYKSINTNITGYVGFNVNRPPFDDARVRRAFALATDRQFGVDHLEMGRAIAASGGFVPPGMPGHVPDVALPYDLNAARTLLVEAGYADGRGLPPLEALLAPWDAVRVAEFLFKPWESDLGVKVRWEIVPSGDVYQERIMEEQPHLNAMGWSSDYRDPDGYLRMGILHISDWRNAAYLGLIERARRIMDHRERMRLYRQAEEILRDEAPIVPLLYLRDNYLIKPWIRNYSLLDDGSLTNRFDAIIIDPH